MATTTSKMFSLNAGDFLKGLLVAALTTPITAVFSSLSAGAFNINWKQMGLVAITGGVSYLLKNLFTPSQVVSTAVTK